MRNIHRSIHSEMYSGDPRYAAEFFRKQREEHAREEGLGICPTCGTPSAKFPPRPRIDSRRFAQTGPLRKNR